MYDAIARTYGIRANAIPLIRKALGEAADGVSDRDLGGALRELVKKRAIATQYQTDTSRVGSIDGSGERKVNKRVRVYVPISYADEADAGRDAAAGGEAKAGGATPGDETDDDLQGRMDGIMAAAAPKKDGNPMGSVLRGNDGGGAGGAGDGEAEEADDDYDDGHVDEAHAAAAGDDDDEEEEKNDDDDDDDDRADISAVERERVNPDLDLRSMGDAVLITMLTDAGSANMHKAIRAELERRRGG